MKGTIIMRLSVKPVWACLDAHRADIPGGKEAQVPFNAQSHDNGSFQAGSVKSGRFSASWKMIHSADTPDIVRRCAGVQQHRLTYTAL